MSLLELRPDVRPVSLADLAAACGARLVRGDGALPVTGVTVDSTDVAPGELFCALAGGCHHGAEFARDALAAGACAVLTDDVGAASIPDETPLLIADDPRAVVGLACAPLYDAAHRDVGLVGITGTNGKTTTTTILATLIEQAFGASGAFGTVEVRLGAQATPSLRTTTEAPVVHRMLALAGQRELPAVVMEASSHAAVLGRTTGLTFDVMGFVNLQHDHLDFHHTMEGYYAAKASYFAPGRAKQGVVCLDDEWGTRLAREAQIPIRTVATSREAGADLYADGITPTDHGTRFTLMAGDRAIPIEMALTGRVMVQNAMVAIGCAEALGIDLETIARGFSHIRPVPGRLEVVNERDETRPLCIVDFAHTAEALDAVLTTLAERTPGRLHIVFGCDGERDQSKRPVMGRVCATLADVLYVTDESPYNEDPTQIRSQIMSGVREVRPDLRDVSEWDSRAAAVRAAVHRARAEDTVVVTGKGPERFQIIAGVYHPYNDVPVIREALAELDAEADR
ncbi:MAG: UDP-N-acetylmuramoyl-L-alanyl-D-glutamate--2,6-diaminopimelate ligase [Bowdeniella nasicola]|nr:UDP-N-acetylmuramoyl-L-alanyl-D-glutamate--2,6-diaminopimelate ligase [Bowdeniella nasicola]